MEKSTTLDVKVVVHQDYVEVRYLGSFRLVLFKQQMEQSAKACLEHKCCRLLVNITELSGYSPITAERHQIGSLGAQLTRDKLKVAVLGTKDQITTDQFTTQVARNRGGVVQTFVDRDEALAWLLVSD